MPCLAKLAPARSAPRNALLMASSFPCAAAACICTADFAPVCGANAQTFSNACQASCAGVAVASEGACPIPASSIGAGNAGDFQFARQLDRIHEALRLVLQNHEDKFASQHNPSAPPYVVVHPSSQVKHGSHHGNALLVWRFQPNCTTLAQATACRAATGCRRRRPTPTACSRRTLGRAAPRCPAGAQPADPGGQNAGVNNHELHTRALGAVC